MVTLKAPGEDPSLPLPASGNSRLCRAAAAKNPMSVSIFTWPLPSPLHLRFPSARLLYELLSLDIRPILNLGDLISRSLITSAGTVLPNKVTFTGSQDRVGQRIRPSG